MSTLRDWAAAWAVPMAAVQDLERRMGVAHELEAVPLAGKSEQALSNLVRVEASRKGMRLFRNNVGVLRDDRGVPLRFGLANDSAGMNAVVKSADLIGWGPGGQFLSVEVKAPGWRFTGTPRELAQQRWAQLVLAAGGRALFVSSEGKL